MAVDSLDKCGIYFGTTGGQVYRSADAGDSWNPIVRDLPAVECGGADAGLRWCRSGEQQYGRITPVSSKPAK